MPHLIVDAAVSRQLGDTIPLFEEYKKKGALNNNVLIGLGTNGAFAPKELDRLMQIIGPKRQVFGLIRMFRHVIGKIKLMVNWMQQRKIP